MAHGKSSALVKRSGLGIRGDSCIPETTHHLHPTGVVPDVGPNDTLRSRRSLHFAYGFCLVRNEIYHETCNGYIEETIGHRQFLSIANLKACAPISNFMSRKRDEAVRRINAGHPARRSVFQDHLAQRTR